MQKRLFIVGAILALVLAGTAWAQQPTTASPVTGRVISVDAMANTFTVQTSNGNVIFKTDGQTMFMRDDTRANVSDIKVGDQVRVTYTGTEPNRIAAHIDTTGTGTSTTTTASGSTYEGTTTTGSTTGTTTGSTTRTGSSYDTTTGATTGTTGTTSRSTMGTTNAGNTITGRVTSVDTSGRKLTIETPNGSQTLTLGTDARIVARNGMTDFGSIYTGDQVRVQLGSDRTVSRIDYVSSSTTGTTTATTTTGSTTTGTTTTGTYNNNDDTLSANRQLPHTASPFPLIGLSGLAMIGIALALRARRLRAA